MANALQLPEAGDSAALLESLFADAFFGKMAEYGFEPQSEREAVSMLETAYHLDTLPEEAPTVKSASYSSPFESANNALKQVLVDNGLISAQDIVNEKMAGVKQAAFACATDPRIYSAVLAVKAAEEAANGN